jgi:hypothetical protein
VIIAACHLVVGRAPQTSTLRCGRTVAARGTPGTRPRGATAVLDDGDRAGKNMAPAAAYACGAASHDGPGSHVPAHIAAELSRRAHRAVQPDSLDALPRAGHLLGEPLRGLEATVKGRGPRDVISGQRAGSTCRYSSVTGTASTGDCGGG